MNRHEFLRTLHERLRPRSYLEIGIRDGRGLAQSRTRTIGVDPQYKITAELACDLHLVKATSDDFFARADALGWFPEGVIDLAFIDGMHLFEFAFRDFINVERNATPHSVVMFDDMLPRSVDEAARDRHTVSWTGDVFKVATVLERYRSDLVVVPLDTEPTGMVLVAGLDPANRMLVEAYDEILAEFVVDDPQQVPDDVLHRRSAAVPQCVLDLPVWEELRRNRDAAVGTPDLSALRALRGTADYRLDPPPAEPWPKPARKPKSGAAGKRAAAKQQAPAVKRGPFRRRRRRARAAPTR
ncbi:MAG TPA: class I SAM-dependent methyltransferase [Mycobacteriales bacterium]|nr:class I SAM-dependent methyltransferase [Mycobacteriales bacterium]